MSIPHKASRPASALAHDEVRALYTQARLIEGMWSALGLLLTTTAALAVTSGWLLGPTVLACVVSGVVGALLGFRGGRAQTARLRMRARSLETQVRNLIRRSAPVERRAS